MEGTQSASGDLAVRLLAWLIRQVGARTLAGMALLALVLSSVVVGISQVSRQLDTGAMSMAALVGMLLGWHLGRSLSAPRAGLRAAVWSGLGGLVWVSLSVGRLWGALGQVGEQGIGLVIQAQLWRYADPLPDIRPFLAEFSDLGLRASQLVQKESAWLSGLVSGAPSFDPLAASLLWGLAFWSVSTWAGWWLRYRQQPLWAGLPAVMLLGGGLAFNRASPLYLFPVLAGWLALLAWSHYERRQWTWEQHSVDTAEGLTLDLSLWGMAMVMAISSVAYLLATFSPAKTAEAVQRMFQPDPQIARQVGQSLGLEQRPTPTPLPPPPGVLPRKHLIGAGPELSQRVVMVVSVAGTMPPSEPAIDPLAPGASIPQASAPAGGQENLLEGYRSAFYWRAVTYDYYTGQGWMTSPTDSWSYQAGEVVSPTLANPAQPVTITVEMPLAGYSAAEDSQAPLYLDGELVSLNREFEADWRPAAPDPMGAQSDLFRAWLPGLPEAETYQAQARLLTAGEQELRQAVQPPPDWIAERYLTLPENLPPRVRALGQALAGSADNPYDRARAIEATLRRYPYTLDLPPPPPGRELTDYFLFDLRRGFCDYYATAMVVLARAAGLPARLAVGYAQGAYNPTRQAFIVTEAEAHSWPEIYFSGIGWVTFEPTGGRPALDRPAQAPPEFTPADAPASQGTASHGRPSSSLWNALRIGAQAGLKLLAGAGFLLALAWLGWVQLQAWRLRRLAPELALEALYQRLRRAGLSLGLAQPPGQTPYELAGLLGERLVRSTYGPRRIQQRLHSWLAPAPTEARRLVELYARAAYSPHPPGQASVAQALQSWRSLERRVWLARLYQRITRK